MILKHVSLQRTSCLARLCLNNKMFKSTPLCTFKFSFALLNFFVRSHERYRCHQVAGTESLTNTATVTKGGGTFQNFANGQF